MIPIQSLTMIFIPPPPLRRAKNPLKRSLGLLTFFFFRPNIRIHGKWQCNGNMSSFQSYCSFSGGAAKFTVKSLSFFFFNAIQPVEPQ